MWCPSGATWPLCLDGGMVALTLRGGVPSHCPSEQGSKSMAFPPPASPGKPFQGERDTSWTFFFHGVDAGNNVVCDMDEVGLGFGFA